MAKSGFRSVPSCGLMTWRTERPLWHTPNIMEGFEAILINSSRDGSCATAPNIEVIAMGVHLPETCVAPRQ
jgi:hypothetical protein